MTEARMKMIDNLIRVFGFECPAVVSFAWICENKPDTEKANDFITRRYNHMMKRGA